MLRGLTTVSFHAADLEAAKRRYTAVLGIEPYFERPGYIEFRVGDYQHELGVIDSGYAPAAPVSGPFGNVLGVMRNPHYLAVLEAVKGGTTGP